MTHRTVFEDQFFPALSLLSSVHMLADWFYCI